MALCDDPTVSIIEPETVADVIRESGKQVVVTDTESRFAKKRFQFFEVGELTRDIRPTDWLIEDFIEADTLALCFAPPASFKSFFAVDIAASIATGTPWHGNEVKPGAVFYIAGEGREGLKKRFRAWEIARGTETKGHPLYLSSEASDLLSCASVGELMKHITETSKQSQTTPRLIVLDTLARNFGGGNENDTKDMNQFVTNVDAVRQAWGCTVLVVHHTGHNSIDRGRGSSALKAALDAEYQLTRQEDSKLVCVKNTKMKDAESPKPITFELHTVELGLKDHRGQEVTSAVLLESDKEFKEQTKRNYLSGNHEALLQAVRSRTAKQEPATREVIRDDLKAQGCNVNAFAKWLKKLVDGGLLRETEQGLFPVVNE